MEDLVGVDEAADALRAALQDRAVRVVLLCGPPCCGKTTVAERVATELGITLDEVCVDDATSHGTLATTVEKKLLTETIGGGDAVVLIDNLDGLLEMDRAIHAVVAASLIKSPKRVLVIGAAGPCRRRLGDWKVPHAVVELTYPAPEAAARFMMRRVPGLDAEHALKVAAAFNGHVHAAINHLSVTSSGAADEQRFIGLDVYDVARAILEQDRYETTERLASFEPSMLPALLYENVAASSHGAAAWAKDVFARAAELEDFAAANSDGALRCTVAALQCQAYALAKAPGAARKTIKYNQILNKGATRFIRTRRIATLAHTDYMSSVDYETMLLRHDTRSPFAPRMPAMATMPKLLRECLKTTSDALTTSSTRS